MVIVSFESERLRALCLEASRAEAEFGNAVASDLRTMIAEIEAWDNAREWLSNLGAAGWNCCGDCVTVPFGGDHCAEFQVVGQRYRKSKENDEQVDWSSVQRLKLLAIRRTQ